MHTLFALEDMYGIKIGEIDGELCLRLDREHKEYQHLFTPFHAWQQMAAKLESGEISQAPHNAINSQLVAFFIYKGCKTIFS